MNHPSAEETELSKSDVSEDEEALLKSKFKVTYSSSNEARSKSKVVDSSNEARLKSKVTDSSSNARSKSDSSFDAYTKVN